MFLENPRALVKKPRLSQVVHLTPYRHFKLRILSTSPTTIDYLAGSKGSSLGPEKSARKAPAVISIFDDSSREGSENSQDDEQFRARKEFLKSGLPESFRKQIAKTAATKEAYSLACSSFQPVTHVKQTRKGRLCILVNKIESSKKS